MEQRLSNSWRMTINERKFIEQALLSDLRVDGRRPFDYRRLTVKFGRVATQAGWARLMVNLSPTLPQEDTSHTTCNLTRSDSNLREDGSSEVQLGQTHVMGFVTAQLIQPYRDRPNEGALSIFTEFSPMADPSFEPGRAGEFAVELGRIIDRGLRESRAVDTESLCVLAGKLVWSIRVDLHILDNGGNLIDAANVAALAALLTFRRPECTVAGEDGQDVTVHPPEIKEPLPLIIHHLPIAVTFAFFGNGNIVVIDPTYNEEAIMGGRMTVTMNTNSDVCAVQKGGGEGVMQSVIMQCLRVASVKAADITSKIKNAVETYNTERALRKVKRHSSLVAVDVDRPDIKMREPQEQSVTNNVVSELSRDHVKSLQDGNRSSESNVVKAEISSSQQGDTNGTGGSDKIFIGGPSSWDPYSKGIVSDSFKGHLPSTGSQTVDKEQKDARGLQKPTESQPEQPAPNLGPAPMYVSHVDQQMSGERSLKDAVKPKNRRKKKSVANDGS